MTKKLEPGCKAITVNCLVPENNGKIVTVIKYVGELAGWFDDDRWLIDAPLKVVFEDGTETEEQSFTLSEKKLRRLDDKEATGTWEEISHLWVPEQVKTRGAQDA